MRTWKADETAEFDTFTLRAVVIMLWKRKGSKEDLDQYRRICFLAIISRILARIVSSLVLAYVEKMGLLNNCQWGFRANRATRDAVLILRIICELFGVFETRSENLGAAHRRRPRVKTTKKIRLLKRTFGDTQPFINLADIKEACPNVDRDPLWLTLKRIGVPSKPISIVDRLHSRTKYVIRLTTGTSDEYELQRGLREGCPSSSTFFIIHHDIPLSIVEQEVDVPTFASGRPTWRRGRNNESALSSEAPHDKYLGHWLRGRHENKREKKGQRRGEGHGTANTGRTL